MPERMDPSREPHILARFSLDAARALARLPHTLPAVARKPTCRIASLPPHRFRGQVDNFSALPSFVVCALARGCAKTIIALQIPRYYVFEHCPHSKPSR